MRNQTDNSSLGVHGDEAGRSPVGLAIMAAVLALTILTLLLLAERQQGGTDVAELLPGSVFFAPGQAPAVQVEVMGDFAHWPAAAPMPSHDLSILPDRSGRAVLLFAWPAARDRSHSAVISETPKGSSTPAPAAVPPNAGSTGLALTHAFAPLQYPVGSDLPGPSLNLDVTPAPDAVTSPTAVVAGASDAGRLVAAAMASLQSGHLEATATLRSGARAMVQVDFDRGGASTGRASHSVSTYSGTGASLPLERVEIGDRSWERTGGSSWAEQKIATGGPDLAEAYLPHIAGASDVAYVGGRRDALHWHDWVAKADVVLEFDPATGIPREMRRLSLLTGSLVVVDYSRWNASVTITPPNTARSL